MADNYLFAEDTPRANCLDRLQITPLKNRIDISMSIFSGNTGSHSVPLAITCMNVPGPVLEMGCGSYSTALLHEICRKESRPLHSADDDPTWLSRFTHMQTGWHTFEHVPCRPLNRTLQDILYRASPAWTRAIDLVWDRIGEDRRWGLVFVDHRPLARRIKDLKRLRPSADAFVIHNTNRIGNPLFGLWPYLSTFRYVYEFPVFPATVVCSDKMDVRHFFQ